MDVSSRFLGKIAVVGAGALGCYYGARLANAGEDVHFLMRSDLDAVRRRGLRVSLPNEHFSVPRPHVYATTSEIGACDLVIVGLKSTANGELASLIPSLLHERTAILTLQNGLGGDELLAHLFGAERVVGGLCFICVNRTAPGEVHCLHPGTLNLGEFSGPAGERVGKIAASFERAGVRSVVGDNLAELRWRKLVWNVPFNGLAIAAGALTTDRILANPTLETEVRALMREIVGAAARVGHVIPEKFFESQIESTRPMGPYQPSSLVDFLAGKEVEVEAIWGEPLRRAQKSGAATPRLAELYATLKRMTAKTAVGR